VVVDEQELAVQVPLAPLHTLVPAVQLELPPQVATEHWPDLGLPTQVCEPAEQSLFEKHVALEQVPGVAPPHEPAPSVAQSAVS
jgi:hypothetical protein